MVKVRVKVWDGVQIKNVKPISTTVIKHATFWSRVKGFTQAYLMVIALPVAPSGQFWRYFLTSSSQISTSILNDLAAERPLDLIVILLSPGACRWIIWIMLPAFLCDMKVCKSDDHTTQTEVWNSWEISNLYAAPRLICGNPTSGNYTGLLWVLLTLFFLPK